MSEIRDALFGDMPLTSWAHGERELAPWSRFTEAAALLEARDGEGAVRVLREIVATPGLESRHYLQAWHALRGLGAAPDGEAKQLLGVVIEVALDEGLDLLAAYADRSARYFNYSGAGVVWERPDRSLDPYVDRLLAAAQLILDRIGPWEGERPPAPPRGQARINLLAPGGLFFGQAGLATLMEDPLAGPAMIGATELMQALIEKSNAS